MNIDDFLRLGGTDISTVVESVGEVIGLNVDDLLLAVGSLVEDLGNSKSDLDLFLLTQSSESSPPLQEVDLGWVIGRCLVNLRVLRFDAIDELLTRLDGWSRMPWNVTQPAKFTYDERIFLHRLLHGRVLVHKSYNEHVKTYKPQLIDVARLKLHVARNIARTIQVDMVGYRDCGDYSSLVFAAQELLGHAVDALLAGHQLTNPNPKWRSRLSDRLPSDWESSLKVRQTGLTASQLIWHLHRAPEQPDKELSIKHACRITNFARAVFVWAELQLVDRSFEKLGPNIWPQIERHPNDYLLPCLELDLDFSFTEGGVAVARLNEFNEPLQMSLREFALLLMFDATTTAHEAETVVYGSLGDDSESRDINRLVSEVVQTGLCISSACSNPAVLNIDVSS
jgi:hypothetical protein